MGYEDAAALAAGYARGGLNDADKQTYGNLISDLEARVNALRVAPAATALERAAFDYLTISQQIKNAEGIRRRATTEVYKDHMTRQIDTLKGDKVRYREELKRLLGI